MILQSGYQNPIQKKIQAPVAKKPLVDIALRKNRLISNSPKMKEVVDQIDVVAKYDLNMIINGKSGTGKELAARLLHERSGRKGKFVAINCAELEPDLASSQIFGHVEGAFTGAGKANKGLMGEAEGGTLFLDEIHHMPKSTLAKLLRAVDDDGEYTALGSTTAKKRTARIVVATNENWVELLKSGFPRDLYSRLDGFSIDMPSLTELGKDDIELIARRTFNELMREKKYPIPHALGEDVMRKLCAHTWPGNVRELKQVIERACIFAQIHKSAITPNDIKFNHLAELDRGMNVNQNHIGAVVHSRHTMPEREPNFADFDMSVLQSLGHEFLDSLNREPKEKKAAFLLDAFVNRKIAQDKENDIITTREDIGINAKICRATLYKLCTGSAPIQNHLHALSRALGLNSDEKRCLELLSAEAKEAKKAIPMAV